VAIHAPGASAAALRIPGPGVRFPGRAIAAAPGQSYHMACCHITQIHGGEAKKISLKWNVHFSSETELT